MKSVFVLCGVLGAVATASDCQADENSLLQSKKSVRKHAQGDSQAMLKNMREVANSLLEGSDTTMTEDEVNDALEHARDIIAELSPAILRQIQNAQQQANDAVGAVQACHAQEQAELRTNLRDYVQQRHAAVESCQETLRHFQADATRQCGIAEDCLCDEARQRATDQVTLCQAMTETYEAAFCEHHHVCTIFHECHSSEVAVAESLRADVEAEMAIIVEEYITVEQGECLMGLVRQSMRSRPRSRIPHAAMIACDDVDVSALRIDYPSLPQEPAGCPAPAHGQPPCAASAAIEPISVNFQNDAVAAPAGWVADTGLVFGPRSGGHTYGWACDAQQDARNRGRRGDVLADTLIAPNRRRNCPDQHWDIELPNGDYLVTLTILDTQYGGYIDRCTLEGNALDGISSSDRANTEHTIEQVVSVSDGALTFAGSQANRCSSVNRITIRSA